MATETEILRCHSNELLELIKGSASMTESMLKEVSTMFDGVYIHPVWYIFIHFLYAVQDLQDMLVFLMLLLFFILFYLFIFILVEIALHGRQ